MAPLDLLTPEPARRFSGEPARNAYVELHNLIAAAESPAEFGPEDRGRISRRHGVDLSREFSEERLALYRAVLDERLANGDLDADDRCVLAQVARTLALSADDLRRTHERAFGLAVTQAVADDCLSHEERLLLYKLQHLLGLNPALADGAYDVIARERLLRVVAGALCDGELTPEEEAEIETVRRSLSLDLPAEVGSMMAGARARWQIRRGELPAVSVGLRLGSGETGHYRTLGVWQFASRDQMERHIGKEVMHLGRTGGLVLPERVRRGRQRTGEIALTSKRLVLTPSDRGLPDEVPLTTVKQLLRFRNGTVVRTQSERHLFLGPGKDNQDFYTVLYRLVFDGGTASR